MKLNKWKIRQRDPTPAEIVWIYVLLGIIMFLGVLFGRLF